MSINEKKRNTTYYYFPPEITIKDKFHKNQNISRMRKHAIIYCSGVDDYIFKQNNYASQGSYPSHSSGQLYQTNQMNQMSNYQMGQQPPFPQQNSRVP